MEFGKVSDDVLATIDFTLPPDPPGTEQALARGHGNTQFYVGCATLGGRNWLGKYYPSGTKESDFRAYYARQFNCVEYSGFFYNKQSKELVEKWVKNVPDDFLYCPKFTQTITHFKRLANTQTDIQEFFEVLSGFGKHLGPLFLMPHPQMAPKERDTIKQFITSLPTDVDFFLELRHPDWFPQNTGYDSDLYAFMCSEYRGLVITDTAGRRDCVHMHLTKPACFIRFVGNSLHPTDYVRIDGWVARIKKWMEGGLEKCYFFMHQPEELHSPHLLKYFIEQLNYHCKTNLKVPKVYKTNTLWD